MQEYRFFIIIPTAEEVVTIEGGEEQYPKKYIGYGKYQVRTNR